MEQKILIALFVDQVAPRFDLATEVFIASMGQMAAGLSKKDRGFTASLGRKVLSSCSFEKNRHSGVWWN